MTTPGGKWLNFGAVAEIGKRKRIRLLLVGDEGGTGDHECYFSDLRECVDLCRHLFDVTCNFTSSGKEAIELMQKWEPNIVMVDAHLRDFNSFDIVRRGCSEHVPVVVMSDYPSAEIERSVREQGAAGYLTKTENPEELESILQQIVLIASEARVKH